MDETGTLDLPGGGIEFGEAPADTVVREFLEETGLSVRVTGLLPPFSFFYQKRFHHLGFLFAVALTGEGELRTGPDDLDSLGALWVKLEDLASHRLSPLAEFGLGRPSTWMEA